ncbi:MAG: 7TM domain-containing protein, partial [Vibrio sp.]
TEGLTITFFPMIILSWTIERMSILWEEEGAKEVLLQGGGSLFTSILIYLAMTNAYVQHLTFNFIGLQLVVLAAILLLGTYTGYRISELRRFKPLVEEK